jgi:type I restriction enzyme M protein
MLTGGQRRQKEAAAKDFKAVLWASADKLRAQMDAAEYKHLLLGLIFLKFSSDSFSAHQPTSRPPRIDAALVAIENENETLRGKLDRRFGRAQLEPGRLGELVDLISRIGFKDDAGLQGDPIGKIYEYFLGQFALAEGKKGGEFLTPPSGVRLLVAVLAPDKGRVYDPCCGSGGMFVSSEEFVLSHGGRKDDISIYDQESNPTTWRLAAMNLAIRGFAADLGQEPADTFRPRPAPGSTLRSQPGEPTLQHLRLGR